MVTKRIGPHFGEVSVDLGGCELFSFFLEDETVCRHEGSPKAATRVELSTPRPRAANHGGAALENAARVFF